MLLLYWSRQPLVPAVVLGCCQALPRSCLHWCGAAWWLPCKQVAENRLRRVLDIPWVT
jgi:hypothetical protein